MMGPPIGRVRFRSMPVVPEQIDERMRPGLRPVRTVAAGPALGFLGWYKAARACGWTRRAALAGARQHRR